MKITTAHKGRVAVLEISGRIDVYTASSVGEAIQSLIVEGSRTVILDLSSVSRVDSSGLGTLVGNSKSISSLGGSLCLVGVGEGLSKILQVTSLAKYFSIYDTVEGALDDLEACAVGQGPPWSGGN